MYPDEALYVWFKKHQVLFSSNCDEIEFKDFGRGSANVFLDARDLMISVSAWNSSLCLDIEILEVETEECQFPHVGDCESIEEFQRHLSEFLSWFLLNVAKNA
jgi:hypothetical protein